MVYKTEGKTRHQLGREGLLDKIWTWKDKYHGNITNQLKRLGGSMDWTREAFTMDENLSLAVRKTFITCLTKESSTEQIACELVFRTQHLPFESGGG